MIDSSNNTDVDLEHSPALARIFYGKRIILGIGAGIAIYKTCELARLLTKLGATVQAVLTPSASRMVAPEVLSALTGQTAWVDQWQQNAAGMMAHIALSRNSDVILVAPTTANIFGKVAQGLADDLLTTMIVGRPYECPLLLAPAMNTAMWENAATQRNRKILMGDSIDIIPPDTGMLACGEEGPGRMPEPQMLVWHLARKLYQSHHQWHNKKIVMTLGPTYEPIDPVRGITNISSGAMGSAMAKMAWLAGADVTVVAGGHVSSFLKTEDKKLRWINVITAQEMYDATMQEIVHSANKNHTDMFIGVAAVADYRSRLMHTQKIKKQKNSFLLELIDNVDILQEVAALQNGRPSCVIGFAAESDQLYDHAQDKLHRKNLDYIVANDVAHAFGKNTNSGSLIKASKPDAPIPLPHQHKELMAMQIFDVLEEAL